MWSLYINEVFIAHTWNNRALVHHVGRWPIPPLLLGLAGDDAVATPGIRDVILNLQNVLVHGLEDLVHLWLERLAGANLEV